MAKQKYIEVQLCQKHDRFRLGGESRWVKSNGVFKRIDRQPNGYFKHPTLNEYYNITHINCDKCKKK